MTAIIQDARLIEELIRERQEAGSDRWDEVWDGVFILMPLPNIEHQGMVGKLTSVLQITLGFDGPGEVFAGVNVSDRDDDWTKNYRCPDVAVYLSENPAERRNAYWLGGPDLAVEVVSPDDRSRDKLAFYARAGTRELLILDRDPWTLELYRLDSATGLLEPAGASTPDAPAALASAVVPLAVGLELGEGGRPALVVTHEDGRSWRI